MSDSTISRPKIYIYALKDPFTDEIRYIGKSIRPRERLTNQCNEKANTHRCHWIQSVLQKGSRPIQIILEELEPDADWQSAEKSWIAYAREQGWPLTNTTDGGDGVPGLSGDSKARMLATWKGRKHKPESLLKIGAASKGRKFSPEALKRKSDKMKGRVFSPKHLAKISKSNSKFDDEDIAMVHLLLSQDVLVREIASIFNVHRTTVSKIKTGQYAPSSQKFAVENKLE